MRDKESGWTIDTLRLYFERVLQERQATLDLILKTQQDALTLARVTLEVRLEKLNELRQEVTSDRGNYVTKEQFEAKQDSLEKSLGAGSESNLVRIIALERDQSADRGRGIGLSTAWGVALGALGALATAVSMVYLIIKLTGH